MTRENNQAANKTWVWTYDNAGNILSKAEYEYTTESLENVTPTDTVSYTYGNSNWGDLLTAYDGQTITYDEIGNPIPDGTWTYTWEHGRQLAIMTDGTTTWTYTYDANGLRTSRSDGTTTYKYIYNGDQLVQMNTGSNTLYFTYDASGTPMTVTLNGETYYYFTNLQGDITAILDGTGNAVVQYSYDAWGNIIAIAGSMVDTLGALNPLRYRGYVYDCDTQLYYLQSRYYDPEIGRFINADSYASTGQGILGNNMFAYCNNNPITSIDPTGHFMHSRFAYFCCESSGGCSYITDQTDSGVGEKKLGVTTVSHGGCGVVATYNALLSMGDYKSFDDVLTYYNQHFSQLNFGGLAGIMPGLVAQYF